MQSTAFGRQFLETLFFVVPHNRTVGTDGEAIEYFFIYSVNLHLSQKDKLDNCQAGFIYLKIPKLCIVENIRFYAIKNATFLFCPSFEEECVP